MSLKIYFLQAHARSGPPINAWTKRNPKACTHGNVKSVSDFRHEVILTFKLIQKILHQFLMFIILCFKQLFFKILLKSCAAFQIAYFLFVLLVHTAAALTKYVLLHTVCIQLGHATGDFTD